MTQQSLEQIAADLTDHGEVRRITSRRFHMNTNRIGAICGVLFATALVAGLLFSGTPPTGSESTDEEVVAWFDDSGNQRQQLAAGYVLTIAALSAVGFVTLGLAPRIARRGQPGDVHAASFLRALSAVLAAGIAVGACAIVAVSAQALIADEAIDPGSARFLPAVGYGSLLVLGGLSGGLIIAIASIHALRGGSLPAWLAWIGIVCAVLLLAAVFFLPMLLLAVWVLLASVVLLRESA